MRVLRFAGLSVIIVLLHSSWTLWADDPKPDLSAVKRTVEDLILGKWEMTKFGGAPEMKVLVEFGRNGKVAIRADVGGQIIKIEGKYKFTGEEDQIEMTVEVMGNKQTTKTKLLKLTEYELDTKSDGQEEVAKFKKVK